VKYSKKITVNQECIPDLPGQMLLWEEPSKDGTANARNGSESNPQRLDATTDAIPGLLET
jgi:hypothetical protein